MNQIVAVPILLAAFWLATAGLVAVDQGHVAILIRKTGNDLADGEIAAPDARSKGVQKDVLTEGWHFLNPYTWETNVVPQVEVPGGKLGLRVRKFGAQPVEGNSLAGRDEKGVEGEILKPGKYAMNTLLYSVELWDAVAVPAGHVGVVTRACGKEPEDPNVFVVHEGERGVQPKTLPPGTHYLNPYEFRVVSVELRSHRFDMIGENVVEFLSKDGFLIRMEASVEWFIDSTQVARVFMRYVDSRILKEGANPGEEVMRCIVEKVLLPNARAFSRIEGSRHLARDFISGETRQLFQDRMLKGLKDTCAHQGIVIQTALVRRTEPPKEIADPIRQREITILQRDKLQQEMAREKQQKTLSQAVKLQERVKLINQAEADVAVAITEATRAKEVALIDASRKLEVAQLELDAAQNQAAARLSVGRATADMKLLANTAEASGLRVASTAFGGGESYVRSVFLKKVAPAIQQVVSNTDGPLMEMFRTLSAAKARPATASGR